MTKAGTFLYRQEFKARFGHWPEALSFPQVEIPGELAGNTLLGVFFSGIVWLEYRQVTLEVSVTTVREEAFMPPQMHIELEQDTYTYNNKVKERVDQKGHIIKQFHASTQKQLTEKMVLDKVAALEQQQQETELASPIEVGSAVSVPVASSSLKPAVKGRGRAAAAAARQSAAGSEAGDPATPTRQQSFGGASTLGDAYDECGVDRWIAKLPLVSILGGWKPGRLTGHAEEKANSLLDNDETRG